jgi:hypothetical protein
MKAVGSRYPEPGDWVDDNIRGFEPIEVPEQPYNGPKMSNADVRRVVANEGLGFCIHQYIRPNKIESAKLRSLWRKAKQTMIEIVKEMG